MYNRHITCLTRWATVGTVVTILLNGCASTPPTPVPVPLPGDTPQVGTGTSSSPDVGTTTSGNPTGGTITLPSNPTPSSSSTTTSDDDASYHTVSPKETLYSIAKQYGHTTAEIKAWNSLTSDSLSVGKRLRVAPPAGGSASSTSSASSASACHKVVHGDTLFSIAKHYGHKVADVAKWNGIKNPSTYPLKVGQMLQVSSDGSCQ